MLLARRLDESNTQNNDEHDYPGIPSTSPGGVIRRPLAVKAASATMHSRMVQEFAAQCAEQGIDDASAIQAAVEKSQDWHRKWTFQDERGHTMPHDGLQDSLLSKSGASSVESSPWSSESGSSGVVAHGVAGELDRAMGAKNPSLCSSSSLASHLSEESSEEEDSSEGQSVDCSPESTSCRNEEPSPVPPPQFSSTPLFRPVAVRATVPQGHGRGNPTPPPPLHHLPKEEVRRDAPSPFWLPSAATPHPVVESSCSEEFQHSSIQHHTFPLQHQQIHQQQHVPIHIVQPDVAEVDDTSSIASMSMPSSIPSFVCPEVSPNDQVDLEMARERLLHALAISGGDVNTQELTDALAPLAQIYEEWNWDARDPEGLHFYGASAASRSMSHHNGRVLEGMWLTLSKPTYFGNLGENGAGDPMYTLGRMAFDMFLPTQLVCSLQGNFNPVRIVGSSDRTAMLEQHGVPKSLVEEVDSGCSILRTYDIVTAFTIEPHLADYPEAPNKNVRRPIKGIMTTNGYVLPDPVVPNRLSIWFTGGRIEPNDDPHDRREWHRFFGSQNSCPEHQQRTFGEKIRLLAANLLMGAEAPKEMEADGSMNFTFTRPLGGHGVAYIDVVYIDDTLRIVRGHRGTIFVFSRIPDHL